MQVRLTRHDDLLSVGFRPGIDREAIRRLANYLSTGDLPLPSRVVLDFAEALYIDDGGIDGVLELSVALENRGSQLRLARVNPNLAQLLAQAQLDAIFDFFESVEEALKTPSHRRRLSSIPPLFCAASGDTRLSRLAR